MKPRYRMSPAQIQELLQMRKDGHSLSVIGRHFGKDHTSILYHCQKAGLSVSTSVKIKTLENEAIVPKKIIKRPRIVRIDDDGDRINPGKDYKDYLEEEKKRNWAKRKDLGIGYSHLDK